MMARWLFLSLFMAGCGTHPQKPAAPSSALHAEQDPAARPAETSPTPKEIRREDLRAVVQAALDDEELDPYLKLGEPGRFPVKVAGEGLDDLGLTRSNEPVVVVEGPESEKGPVLVITDVSIEGDKGTVSYRYEVEGLKGSAVVGKRDGEWQLLRSRVVQH